MNEQDIMWKSYIKIIKNSCLTPFQKWHETFKTVMFKKNTLGKGKVLENKTLCYIQIMLHAHTNMTSHPTIMYNFSKNKNLKSKIK